MKHSFLILSVASLFLCSGCAKKRKLSESLPSIHQGVVQVDGAPQPLIKRSSQSIVQASLVKAQQEELPVTQKSKVVPQVCSTEERIAEIEARLGDLPVPLLAQPKNAVERAQGQYVITYVASVALDDLETFYGSEMEKLGWARVAAFEGEELLYTFKKNKQACIISAHMLNKPSWWSKKHSTELRVYLQA